MPSLEYEHIAQAAGGRRIAGLDEAGRGALAGPVTAGAVILPLDDAVALAALSEVNDSKQLTAARRAVLYDLVVAHSVAWGVGAATAAEIDEHGIVPATRLAMRRALASLDPQPDYLLIDGRIRLRTVNISQQSIIRGDGLSLSIAAASIVAKVTRDRQMIASAVAHPAYGFERHKGYGTVAHRTALEGHGPCELHRRSFAPLKRKLSIDNYQLSKRVAIDD